MNLKLHRLALVVLCAAVAAGCAASRTRSGLPYDRNSISPPEIAEAMRRNVSNAYDLVRSTRPEWLREAASAFGGTAGQVVVFADQTRVGGVGSLRSMPLRAISWIRYLGPSEAAAEFGRDVQRGAIQVVTIR
jgi:hypothetical protein